MNNANSLANSVTRCYLGLGSNLENPQLQLLNAITAIDQLNDVNLHKQSHLYKSTPIGPQDQPSYLNAVVEISTHLPAEELLDCLQAIENQQGRIRKGRWGARTLDIDILLYGDEDVCTERLTIPHKELKNRNFVLLPLADLNKNLMLPDGQTLQALLACTSHTDIKRISTLMDQWANN